MKNHETLIKLVENKPYKEQKKICLNILNAYAQIEEPKVNTIEIKKLNRNKIALRFGTTKHIMYREYKSIEDLFKRF